MAAVVSAYSVGGSGASSFSVAVEPVAEAADAAGDEDGLQSAPSVELVRPRAALFSERAARAGGDGWGWEEPGRLDGVPGC